ncbi:MAG: hypothetical protein V1793_15780 [Pseudomonadota bacterium]
MKHDVTVFRPYPFEKGQKIRIEGSKRQGDWEVIEVSDIKMTLRCPISHREFTWDRFCCLYEEQIQVAWPKED